MKKKLNFFRALALSKKENDGTEKNGEQKHETQTAVEEKVSKL